MKTLNEHHELVKFVIFWLILPIMATLWGWFLLHAYPRLGEFAFQLFCDASGKPSLGHVASMFALTWVVLWVNHIVWKKEIIPDLFNPLLFVGGLYSIAKIPEIVSAFKGVQLPSAKVDPVPEQH